MRVGMGYDVHKLVEDRKLILGGVEIPYEKGLLGHSDADVLLHAIMDALLGAAALGDIGRHFPDTDDRYKGADSMVLLKKVKKLLDEKFFFIENIDATVIAQQPKLAPYIEDMRKNIAECLELPVNRVNVKATTEEKLGFTGAGLGISSQAVCLLETVGNYDYDVMGNKVLAEKERPGLPEDSGNFSYDYDALNRLTSVACNGKTLRTYGYDAFGNRNTRTEYQTAGELVTTYHYNTKNQLTQETNASGTKNYNYDHRGNLLSVTSGEEVLKAYGFDAANRMSSSVDRTAGEITKAYYQYNGLGHRVGQTIASGNADVTQTIRYTLDLTRQYHNLLQKTGNGLDQTYFWDGNVAGMEENGRDHFYFQDDLGSPMRLADEGGRSEEVYGFDEFGNDIRTAKDIFKDSLQSFGFTGYQMDSVGALYFAQARRYDAGVGRFISEDFIKGHIAAPYTMNHYSYCWNRPLDLVDLNGMDPNAGVIKALMDMLKCDETVSYIFYTTGENSDFTDQANWKKEQLESEGKNVVMIPIANANDFVDGWNHMGMTPDGIANIEDVEIYTHSNETTFIFIDNTETEALSISGKNKSGKAIKGISDLSYKEIETLNIYGCNSGNLSTYFIAGSNIASGLSKIVSGDVYAYDGNVAFGPTWTRPFSKYGEYEDRLSNIQKSYIKISVENRWFFEPMGKLRYKEGKLDGKCDE